MVEALVWARSRWCGGCNGKFSRREEGSSAMVGVDFSGRRPVVGWGVREVSLSLSRMRKRSRSASAAESSNVTGINS